MHKRIFISHVNDDDAFDRFLPRLCERLELADFDVLIDRKRLLPGERWRNEIYTWVGVCHAAVVLLSEQALVEDSLWVARETALLMWRKALDPRLQVIPVLAPTLDISALEASGKFRDLQLRELQMVLIGDAERAIEDIMAGLRQGSLVDNTPLDELANVIAHRLRGIAAETLEYCADGPLKDVLVPATRDPDRRLALKLLSADFGSLAPALDYLMPRCPAQARGDFVDIFSLLAANWVDPEAAQWIARESAAGAANRASRPIILNASTEFAVRMYLQRASLKPPSTRWPMVAVTGVEGGHGASLELADEIEAALQEQLPLKPDAFNKNMRARRARQLQASRERGLPVFVAMPLPTQADVVRRAVNEAFPSLSLFFVAGAEPPSVEDYPESDYLHLLPPIAKDAEAEAETLFDAYSAAYSLYVAP